jgi:hypothetical protein
MTLTMPTPPGAPSSNATLFCDATGCFTFTTRPTPFNQARTACQAAGGELYVPISADQQQGVEVYFRRRNQLPFYWVGVSRANKQQAYQRVDGDDIPQIINTSPYTHWVRLAAAGAGRCTWPPAAAPTPLPDPRPLAARIQPLQPAHHTHLKPAPDIQPCTAPCGAAHSPPTTTPRRPCRPGTTSPTPATPALTACWPPAATPTTAT